MTILTCRSTWLLRRESPEFSPILILSSSGPGQTSQAMWNSSCSLLSSPPSSCSSWSTSAPSSRPSASWPCSLKPCLGCHSSTGTSRTDQHMEWACKWWLCGPAGMFSRPLTSTWGTLQHSSSSVGPCRCCIYTEWKGWMLFYISQIMLFLGYCWSLHFGTSLDVQVARSRIVVFWPFL